MASTYIWAGREAYGLMRVLAETKEKQGLKLVSDERCFEEEKKASPTNSTNIKKKKPNDHLIKDAWWKRKV